jgi:hypothetical protein
VGRVPELGNRALFMRTGLGTVWCCLNPASSEFKRRAALAAFAEGQSAWSCHSKTTRVIFAAALGVATAHSPLHED